MDELRFFYFLGESKQKKRLIVSYAIENSVVLERALKAPSIPFLVLVTSAVCVRERERESYKEKERKEREREGEERRERET